MRTNLRLKNSIDSNGGDMKHRGKVRRAAMAASGLALATSLGLTGAGVASAASPASHHQGALDLDSRGKWWWV